MNPTNVLRSAVASVAVVLIASAAPAWAVPATTVDNLQTAYNGESNAHAKYLAFAQAADQEGYGAVASLFRAAASAEAVHAKTHASTLEKLGAKPVADVKPPRVGSTRENLQAALEGETYERDKMYPGFVAAAKAEKNTGALRAFNFALTAEGEHAKLYTAALNDLPQWKGPKTEFYVCPVCGYTVRKIDFTKCPSCFTSREKYVTVS